jgi:hypothetical protein
MRASAVPGLYYLDFIFDTKNVLPFSRVERFLARKLSIH